MQPMPDGLSIVISSCFSDGRRTDSPERADASESFVSAVTKKQLPVDTAKNNYHERAE